MPPINTTSARCWLSLALDESATPPGFARIEAMRLKIVQAGDPVLRQEARPLETDEILLPETQQLIEWMRDTMRDAPGVGLAAPQVGLPIQLVVIEDRTEYQRGVSPDRERQPAPFQVFINPRIVAHSEEQVEFFEGCLSVAGFSALVKRYRAVRVEYLDEQAVARSIEGQGWYARILQHEIDHLGGTLYIDRMRSRTLATGRNFSRYWAGVPIDEALAILEKKVETSSEKKSAP